LALEVIALLVLLAATAAAAKVRPGALLEVGAIGVFGAAAWIATTRARSGRSVGALVGLAFVLPLTNTWPGRVWELALEASPSLAIALLAPSTLVLAAAAVLTRSRGAPAAVPRLLWATAALLVVGAVASTVVSGSSAAASTAALQFVVPLLIAGLILRVRPDTSQSWLVLTGLLAGASVPAVVGIAAYILSFGVPTSPNDLVAGKIALARPFLFQELTFGNVGHFATLAVLLLPVGLVGAARRQAHPIERTIAGVASVLLLAILLLTLSRLAVVAAVGSFALLGLLTLVRRDLRATAVIAAAAAVVIAVSATGPVRDIFQGVLTDNTAAISRERPGSGASGTGTLPPDAGDESTEVRRGALEAGMRVFEHHVPFGVGSGRYPIYDPVHTAPHSLAVQLLAENGILGGAGLLTLLAFLGVAGYRLLTGGATTSDERRELGAGCWTGATAFLGLACVGGAPLAIDETNVWAASLALLVATVAMTTSWTHAR
jgi:hypothetical protein